MRQAGKLRALAVTTATRMELLPDIPTMSDFVPGFEAIAWYGVRAPKSTPAKVIEKLNRQINAGLADPRLKARLADLGGTVFPTQASRRTERASSVTRISSRDRSWNFFTEDNSCVWP